MEGELALAIALAAHGNAYLASAASSKPPELVGTSSTLQYVNSLVFREAETGGPFSSAAEGIRRTEQGRFEDIGAFGGTSAWYLKLRREGASRLRIVKLPIQLDLPEVDATAFAGGIPWAIQVDFPSFYGLWIPRWKHEGGRKKPWKVHLDGFTVAQPAQWSRPDLVASANSLHKALDRALEFSNRAKLDYFPDDFTQALALLSSPCPEIPHHPDLLPTTGYSVLARQVIASAARAWVFGGMMSFNDLGFDDLTLNDEYKALLPRLYETVVNALLSATNSFGQP